ncbi:MAG: AAA family ATPase [Phycisphaerae bacterium]|nr:AAA family ATPase [Phycisphaerae bacterium]
MIRSVEVNNFRCLERLTVPEFGRFTLVGGRNNVGKSSLLEALFLFMDRMSPHAILRQHNWRGLGKVENKPVSLWAPVFFDYDLSRTICLVVQHGDKKETLSVSLRRDYRLPNMPTPVGHEVTRVDTSSASAPTEALEFVYASPGEQPQKMHLLFDPIRGPSQFIELIQGSIMPTSYLGSRARPPLREDADSFGELDKRDKIGLVLGFLQKLEPQLKQLSIIPVAGEPVVHADLGLSRKIPIVFAGDGMSRMLSLLMGIVRARGGLVLIDEFENGLHYSAHSDIWNATLDAARELDCQVIATTHSYEFLRRACEGLPSEFAKEFRYLRLDRTPEGIVAHVFDHETLSAAFAAGLEVR